MADVITKVCFTCKLEKPIEEFYNSKTAKDGHTGICIECNRKKQEGYREFKDEPPRVLTHPGQYVNEKQKKYTFQLLEMIGWKYNEKTGIWWKLPRKDKFGTWVFPATPKVKEPKVLKYRKHTTGIIKNRKLDLAAPPKNYKRKKAIKNRSLSDEQLIEVRKLYQQEHMTQARLAFQFGVSQGYINQIIHYKI